MVLRRRVLVPTRATSRTVGAALREITYAVRITTSGRRRANVPRQVSRPSPSFPKPQSSRQNSSWSEVCTGRLQLTLSFPSTVVVSRLLIRPLPFATFAGALARPATFSSDYRSLLDSRRPSDANVLKSPPLVPQLPVACLTCCRSSLCFVNCAVSRPPVPIVRTPAPTDPFRRMLPPLAASDASPATMAAFTPPAPIHAIRTSLTPATVSRSPHPVYRVAAPRRATSAPSRTYTTPRAAADFYETLGVSRSASDSDIKAAFRQKARKLHPDVNKEPNAKERFQEVSRAYEVLSDSQMRARYDQFGEAGVSTSAAGGNGFSDFSAQDFGSFSDIFDTFFGGQGGGGGSRSRRSSGPQQGDDLRLDVDVSFEKAVFGAEQKIRFSHLETCTTCSGSGVKPGSRPRSCGTCNGSGTVTQVVRTPLGMFQQTGTCTPCRGTGEVVDEYCGSCGGRGRNQVTKQLMITVPPGVDTGSRLRIRNEGDAGPKGGPPGDLYVMLRVKESGDFTRDGINVYSKVKVSYLDAILGRSIRVKTVDGTEMVTVAAGTQPGTVMRINGKGVPKLGNNSIRGDHFVTVEVKIPTRLSTEERQLVEQLDELGPGKKDTERPATNGASVAGGPKDKSKAAKGRGDGFFNFGKK